MSKLYSSAETLSVIIFTKIALSKVISQICDSAIKIQSTREITALNRI
ncbi:hypothetical protein CO700_15300 [Citrobacter koseri]|nr:hypothetical protein CO700_15300 [Citrobacter koseri]AVE58923.1 hypothetical protein AM352_11325 [Citrobacter koseri]